MHSVGITDLPNSIFVHQKIFNTAESIVKGNGCVLACLNMVLNYYNIPYELESVFKELEKSAGGVKFDNAAEFLKGYSSNELTAMAEECKEKDYMARMNADFLTQEIITKIVNTLNEGNLIIIGAWTFDSQFSLSRERALKHNTIRPGSPTTDLPEKQIKRKHAILLTGIDYEKDIEGMLNITKAYVLDPDEEANLSLGNTYITIIQQPQIKKTFRSVILISKCNIPM